MKKFYLTFCLLLAFSVSKAQYIFMDGTEGGAFLIQKYPGCFMPGNMFDTTCAAIVNEDTLILSNWNLEDNSLPYIHYFKNLKYLDISNNVLDHLPPLPSTLETFLCNNQDGSFNGYIGGSIINLPALPPGLKVLNCGSNRITNWPAVWPSTLEHLNISNNNLSSLPALPPGLKYLDCSNQQVVIEYISVNILPALDTILSLPPGLTHLICHSNSLTAVPTLPPTLKYLDCSNNRYLFNLCTTGQCVPTITYANGGIASLPNWPPQLEYLNVAQGSSYNVLGFYSFVLPQIIPASLIDLTADSISPQMILPPGLKYLSAGFETKCLPNLPASLGAQSPYRTTPVNLYLNSSSVNCIPNNVPGMRVSPVTIPYCNIQNNTNNCVADPSITGYVFYDLNSNGIWDPGEYPKQGVKVTNDNGIIGFSNINGQYAAQGHLGNNVTSITPPLYYNAVPASFNHTLNTADTLITDTVALQPNVSIDSMRITITPMNAARRGWDLPYHVKYENVGTTVVNANIVVNYNNALLTPTAGPLNLSLNNIGPGQRGEFTTTFYISTSAAFGAEVYTTATITAGTSTSTDESYLNVIFSFDPNDKHATPILTSAEVNAGEFIDYLVRFQNVGNDTAFNINITDQLSEHLIANTLEVIEASHACKTTQINDYLNFEFENILLPDSNVNEPASHGYIRFRVKPKTGLPINTDVPNNAAIYFDFNAPVITNDAITIVNFAPVPLTLLSFSGMVQPENNVLLSWKTAGEINTSRYDIEQGNDGRKFDMAASVAAVGSGDNSYSRLLPLPDGVVYYRLRINDIDGRVSYSHIVKISGGKNKVGFVLLNNPVKNDIHINLLNNNLVNTNASIISSQGIVVKSLMLNGGLQRINVSDLAAGLYFIRTQSGTEKIVISK